VPYLYVILMPFDTCGLIYRGTVSMSEEECWLKVIRVSVEERRTKIRCVMSRHQFVLQCVLDRPPCIVLDRPVCDVGSYVRRHTSLLLAGSERAEEWRWGLFGTTHPRFLFILPEHNQNTHTLRSTCRITGILK
jgi:hypothetical protein